MSAGSFTPLAAAESRELAELLDDLDDPVDLRGLLETTTPTAAKRRAIEVSCSPMATTAPAPMGNCNGDNTNNHAVYSGMRLSGQADELLSLVDPELLGWFRDDSAPHHKSNSNDDDAKGADGVARRPWSPSQYRVPDAMSLRSASPTSSTTEDDSALESLFLPSSTKTPSAAAGPDRQQRKINLSRERMKRELVELRERAADLEVRLRTMKEDKELKTQLEIGQLAVNEQQRAVVAAVTAFWERNTHRERKALQRSRAENARLRKLVDDHARTAQALQRIMEERVRNTRLTDEAALCVFMDRLHFTEHEREQIDFALMRNFESMFFQLDHILTTSGLKHRFATHQDLRVRHNFDGPDPIMELVDSRILPLAPMQVVEGNWQHMTKTNAEISDAVYFGEECIGNVVRAKFGIVINVDGTEVFARGRFVAERRLESDRCVTTAAAWVSAEGGALGDHRVEIMDEGWGIVQGLPGSDFSITKDCTVTRSVLRPSDALTPDQLADLRRIANLVHTRYCQILISDYECWEHGLMSRPRGIQYHG